MLIFVQSKQRAKELFHELKFDQVNVDVIHGDKKKQERDEIMQKFRIGDIWVLICTDLMARGIDFKTVNSVLNFDFPTSLVSYIHRVGRTGRAGREGTATTYFTDADLPYVKTIANLMQKSGHEVPSWLAKLKNNPVNNNKAWKQLSERPIRRKTISTSVERNTNRRHLKLIKKDARRIQNRLAKASGGNPTQEAGKLESSTAEVAGSKASKVLGKRRRPEAIPNDEHESESYAYEKE